MKLIPKKHQHKVAEVCDDGYEVEVVLKPGWEYLNEASLAVYERTEFCTKLGTPSETKLRRCISDELDLTFVVPFDQWCDRH